ncbi:hypothetical protein LOC67_23380 [Stieleria sp. JC731]|uniref:hypothetical protein n=1 Tax=Pirellulaceae TaxID=2691357 RepID=UPI001E443A73|nr:hypothetical protein [Stieleria sp. JC731]MCC9603502.1 hypothetical protein [Stieleria sp. JC731]
MSLKAKSSMAMKITPLQVVRRKRKLFTKSAKTAYKKTGETYQVKLRPRRFTTQHAVLAGYAKRSRKYLKDKKNKFGHQLPLVYSGEAKAASNRFKIAVVAASQRAGDGGYAKLTYYALRKLNYRAKNQKANMAQEFRRLLPFEFGVLGQEFDRYLSQEMAAGESS